MLSCPICSTPNKFDGDPIWLFVEHIRDSHFPLYEFFARHHKHCQKEHIGAFLFTISEEGRQRIIDDTVAAFLINSFSGNLFD